MQTKRTDGNLHIQDHDLKRNEILTKLQKLLHLQPLLVWETDTHTFMMERHYLLSKVYPQSTIKAALAFMHEWFNQTNFLNVIYTSTLHCKEQEMRLVVEVEKVDDSLLRTMKKTKKARLRHLVDFLNQLNYPVHPVGKWIQGNDDYPYYTVADIDDMYSLRWCNNDFARDIKKAALNYCRLPAINVEPSTILSDEEMTLIYMTPDVCSYNSSKPYQYPLVVSPLYLILFKLMSYAMPHHYEIAKADCALQSGSRPIGKGAFAKVYKVSYQGKIAAYKYPVGKIDTEQKHVIESSLDECRVYQLLARAKEIDPDNRGALHVLTFHGFISCKPQTGVILVTDFCEGGSLLDMIEKSGKLEGKLALSIGSGVAHGVAYLHEKGIIHRDVKPANVLLKGVNHHAVIADFGLSYIREPLSTRVASRNSTYQVGSVSYLAPEVFSNGTQKEPADVYAVGSVFWAMSHGREPHISTEYESHVANVLSGKRETIDPMTPEQIRRVIGWCWKQEPKNRPNASDLAKRIKDLSAGAPETTNNSMKPSNT